MGYRQMYPVRIRVTVVAMLLLLAIAPRNAAAYSVLAHEAMIDAAWDDQIAPLLRRQFPGTPAEALRTARAYAYGGSLIQDLGYYPFGSRFFSNLVHYVRSGDFVEALMREAKDVNEYAFALGALAHYASDNVGHPTAVNRAVPILFPKVGAKYGADVLYVQSPAQHLMAEFAFDVLQIARGTFKADVYQDLIGFEVAEEVLDRAFRATYGFGLDDVFGDVDLAIGTYRRAASETIPDMTRMAWVEKRDEIIAATPGLTEGDFVFSMTRQQYEEKYGTTYRKPSLFARFIVTIFKILPKFGPFKPLAFEPLTPETEKMFLDSFAASGTLFGELLQRARSATSGVPDTDLDTGMPPAPGVNELADKTYDELLTELSDRAFIGVPPALRAAINEHYSSPVSSGGQPAVREKKVTRQLAALNAGVTATAN